MQQTLFKTFKRVGNFVSGKGFSRIPCAAKIYRFFYVRLRPKGIVETAADNHIFYVNARDTGIAPHLIMHTGFALAETIIFKKILKPGMVFVDIGANIGYFSLLAARSVTNSGKVYAFEPDAEHFSLLQKNIKKNNYSNIIPVNQAASDMIGTAAFYLQKDNLCAHSLLPDPNSTMVEVKTTTLDEYFKQDNRVDVVKIDVEGAEPKVLAGMKQLVTGNLKMAILTEFFPKALKDSGASPAQFLQDLVDLGFILYRIDEDEQKNLSLIDVNTRLAISHNEGIPKLINILCLKNWEAIT